MVVTAGGNEKDNRPGYEKLLFHICFVYFFTSMKKDESAMKQRTGYHREILV